MMLHKFHDSKGINNTVAEAYEQLTEIQWKMKILKLKELELH